MNEIQDANDGLALLGVQLTPLAEMYAKLYKDYEFAYSEYEKLSAISGQLHDAATAVVYQSKTRDPHDVLLLEYLRDRVLDYDDLLANQ
jgi:hypothetical protein